MTRYVATLIRQLDIAVKRGDRVAALVLVARLRAERVR